MSSDREQHIKAILDIAMPTRKTGRAELGHLMRTVGIRYAFWGIGDVVAATLVVSFGILLTVSIFIGTQHTFLITETLCLVPIAILAPTLYSCLLGLTSWKERLNRTWEVVSACRYNLQYVTAIRLIVMSAVGLLFIPLGTLPLLTSDLYSRVLAYGFCSVLLYCTLSLVILTVVKHHHSHLITAGIWIGVWTLLTTVSQSKHLEDLLRGVPTLALAGVIAALVMIHLLQLRRFIISATRRLILIPHS